MTVGFVVELFLAAWLLRWVLAANGLERIWVSENFADFRIHWNDSTVVGRFAAIEWRVGSSVNWKTDGSSDGAANYKERKRSEELKKNFWPNSADTARPNRSSFLADPGKKVALLASESSTQDRASNCSAFDGLKLNQNQRQNQKSNINPHQSNPHRQIRPFTKNRLRVRVHRRSCPFDVDCIQPSANRRLQEMDQFAVKRQIRLSPTEIPSVATAMLTAVFRWRCSPSSRPS